MFSHGNDFIIIEYIYNLQNLVSNYSNSMFFKIATVVIELSGMLIIPKSQHTTAVHLFIEQI